MLSIKISNINIEQMDENEKRDESKLELQLGDIIKITNPVNELLDDQTFIIDYIDKNKMYIINVDTLKRMKLTIGEDGVLGDGNITQIAILSRVDSPSFARQNGLLPGKWINIHFGGDYPTIITGEITNLEDDMIEVKTTDNDMIYINFAYKGIPENLPIDNIEIREKPSETLTAKRRLDIEEDERREEGEEREVEENVIEEELGQLEDLEIYKNVVKPEELHISVPVKDVKDQLREFIVRADQIKFGDEELGPIVQYVDVALQSKRYSIETQVSDLLDELLSTVPNVDRTPRVLNNIHLVIERFKQLRERFSHFDEYGNVEGMILKEASFKPLKNWLNEFNTNLYWIMPVVKNIKKVYDIENVYEENNDVVNLQLSDDIKGMNELIENYRSNNLPSESNKYSALYSEIAKYFTPFNMIDNENQNGIITEKEINSNINTVIDNLEDMYSSVYGNHMLKNRRFAITRYNLADTKLLITDSTSSKMTTIRVPMTNNDIMSIKSIMTLPEPVIRFSKVTLPETDILTKANLNLIYLNYWELLKKKTPVNNVFIDELQNEFEFDESTYASAIVNYILNIPEEEMKGLTKLELYNRYANMIIPKIKVIFNMMKKYIRGKLSIVDVVSYLEPFLIYSDDLTFKQYQQIVEFINEQISKYNKSMVEMSRVFNALMTVRSNPIMYSNAYTVVTLLSDDLRESVLDTGYLISVPSKTNTYEKIDRFGSADPRFTDSEYLRKITIKDYGKLYTSALAYQSIPLMFPKDVSELVELERKSKDEKMKNEDKNDKCDTIVIAKNYNSMEQMEKDNDIIIFFDKKYDKTNYGVMEDRDGYAKEVMQMPPERLKEHIINDQMKKNKLSEADASYLADTLIDGNKKVIDGQYALLYTGYSENKENEIEYYVRKNNKWVLDREIKLEDGITDEAALLCDLQEKCMNVTTKTGDKCESIGVNELSLQTNLLNKIISEFDTKYKVSREEFEKNTKKQLDYFLSIMPIVNKIETNHLLKYNNQRYKMGLGMEDDLNGSAVVSPFAKVLDIILGQQDFVKKQYDIVRFVDKFTRTSVEGYTADGKEESVHWLYCIKTRVPLLPVFKKKLADAFLVSEYEYQRVLEEVKSTNGQQSDDGDLWTDKYTGWPICAGDFDTEEGYDDGFKVTSRAVMEESAGNKIMSATSTKAIKYITEETIMINNIINTLSVAMGINMETQKEFIINCVVETIKTTVEGESEYKNKVKQYAEKGKKIPAYRDFYNTALLHYTFGMFLIGIQTSIPSIRTRKTHPGCVRSFTGYPFDGEGDMSSLTYLACVAFDIRLSTEPWNTLKKTNVDKIKTRIKGAIDDYFLSLPEVQRKFAEKTEYLLANPATEIPEEHDIAKWTDFLPPLIPFRVKHLVNISEQFRQGLNNDLRTGSQEQREKILVIESKIIQFSFAIQEKINEIVKQHKVLLHTANNEPYLENSCCDSTENESTIDYFTSKNRDIEEFNSIVKRLTNILDDIRSYTESPMFYSNINTKNIYPSISNTFDERTIYLAFIFYCKFKTLVPIPEDLMPLCTSKPDSNLINPTDTIDNIIKKLKEDGRNYTNEQFLRLIELISRENIVNIDIDNPVISSVGKLSVLLESIYDENNENEIMDLALRDLLMKAIDTFDIASEQNTKEVKDLNNYLIKTNEDMTNEIIEFVEMNSGPNITRSNINKFIDTIKNLSSWTMDESHRNESTKISDDSMYSIINFYRSFIENFVTVFPNIVLNSVNYDNILIPNYYGFSKSHAKKLKKYISEYYQKLKPFYGVPIITNILHSVQKNSQNAVLLAKNTPCFTSIKMADKTLKGVIDERTSRFLFEYYLLRIILQYVELSDENDMIVTEVQKRMEITDIFSVDYINETEAKIDIETTAIRETDSRILMGNKKQLKQKTSELLIAFMSIMKNEKDTLDITYEDIQDKVFKLREREKDLVTDRLKNLTDESRDIDTMMKIIKQGPIYSKALKKGLVEYEKEFYEDEQEFRDKMSEAERKIRRTNKDANDQNIDILLDEYVEQQQIEAGIDEDAYDMGYINDDYYDGNVDGVDAPEQDYDDFNDYDS